jgi:hypothetical protein
MLKRTMALLIAISIMTSSAYAADTAPTNGPLDSCMRAGLVVGLAGVLGHMLGKQIDHEDIGANLFAVLGMAIDHYLLGGKEDPCSFARVMGYVVMAFARGIYEKKREEQQQRYVVTTSFVM